MGANSGIEWTRHTFNPWRGCTKVSRGCDHCYAETMSKRNPSVLGVWGLEGARAVAAEDYWAKPLKWDKDAAATGERHRVFCASLADVFEGPETMPAEAWTVVSEARRRLFGLIEQTPHLDWLLLTKRPQNIYGLTPARLFVGGSLPSNIWIGTSVEDQAAADERIPELLKVPARTRFLSCEPLLGPVDVSRWVTPGGEPLDWAPDGDAPPGDYNPVLQQWETRPDDGGISWVIVGGESGPRARPVNPEWVRYLRDQCQDAKVSFFFKQWGEYEPYEEDAQPPFWRDTRGRLYDGHGLDVLDPETGEVGRGWHEDSLLGPASYRRVGKKAAGCLLDGRIWDEVPT